MELFVPPIPKIESFEAKKAYHIARLNSMWDDFQGDEEVDAMLQQDMDIISQLWLEPESNIFPPVEDNPKGKFGPGFDVPIQELGGSPEFLL